MRCAHPSWCARFIVALATSLLASCNDDSQELARVRAELAAKTAELEALQGKYEAVNEELRGKVSALDENVARTLVELGKVNDLQGRPREALESFERYLEQHPKAADAGEIANNIAQIKAELRAAEGDAGSARD